MGLAIGHLIVQQGVDRIRRLDVVPIDPVEMPGLIVVAGVEDDAQVRIWWMPVHASRARMSRCHPSSRSSAARSSSLTFAHSGAFTYSCRLYASTSHVKICAFLISLIAKPSRSVRTSSSW